MPGKIGRLAITAALLIPACHELVEPADTGGSSGPQAREPADPATIRAVEVDGRVTLWLDRALAPGERIEWQDQQGEWQQIASSGQVWSHDQPHGSYRWRGPLEERITRPLHGDLFLDADAEALLQLPGEQVIRSLRWDGPAVDGLPLAVALQRRSDGAWLVLEGDEPSWSETPGFWQSFEPAQLPEQLELSWLSTSIEPSHDRYTASLLLLAEDRSWTVATAQAELNELGRTMFWGDFHNHTNLSFDGCEDRQRDCQPRGDTPGSDVFRRAEDAGLDFVALTDHAEFDTWVDVDDGWQLDVQQATVDLVTDGLDGAVMPLLGFEWTAAYNNPEGAAAGGHRTVVFEDTSLCADFWVGAGTRATAKDRWGREWYDKRSRTAHDPVEFFEALAKADLRCGPARRLSWFHHPAMQPPRPVDWTLEMNRGLGDVLVEIHSEHGCSECFDLGAEGCDWQINIERATPRGAVQVALQEGLKLGFVGGTDNHEAMPGSVMDGPGPIASAVDIDGDGELEPYSMMHAPGAVSGVMVAGTELRRRLLFDALEARSTVAASFIIDDIRVAALGADGVLYLPGSEIPAAASPLRVMLELEDDRIDLWSVELLDPWNELHEKSTEPTMDVDIDLAPGEVRYFRIRAWGDGQEHRVWVSPFFGVD
jgi:hypothetical protein